MQESISKTKAKRKRRKQVHTERAALEIMLLWCSHFYKHHSCQHSIPHSKLCRDNDNTSGPAPQGWTCSRREAFMPAALPHIWCFGRRILFLTPCKALSSTDQTCKHLFLKLYLSHLFIPNSNPVKLLHAQVKTTLELWPQRSAAFLKAAHIEDIQDFSFQKLKQPSQLY